MQITETRDANALIVSPAGRIDSTTAGHLEQRLLPLVDRGERRLVVDFGGVEYISSAGLRVLLALAKRMRDVKGGLVLCALRESSRQVFDLAGFLPLFAVEPSRDAAVRRLDAS
jgi:anti-anti-sigma factor